MTLAQLPDLLSNPFPGDKAQIEGNLMTAAANDVPLDRFSGLSLAEVGGAALLDRIETKFVFTENQLKSIFPGLEKEYQILEIQGRRSFGYQSIYLDTPDRALYHQHQAGARPRWKIRLRTYLTTGITFLEVKRKDNRNLTQKTRQQVHHHIDQLSTVNSLLEETNYPEIIPELNPILKTQYTRITLVHKDKNERVTLDRQLCFSDGLQSRSISNLVVAEVKSQDFDPCSPFLAEIKPYQIQPTRFSKYCLGSLLLDPTLKYNRFKPILHHIAPLTLGGEINEWPR